MNSVEIRKLLLRCQKEYDILDLWDGDERDGDVRAFYISCALQQMQSYFIHIVPTRQEQEAFDTLLSRMTAYWLEHIPDPT